MALLQALRGTSDFWGDEIARWTTVERRVRHIASAYGYREIRTPVIEDASLFLRSVGETTDIVQKELFRFADRGGHEIALRPEGTASIVRAYIEHHLDKTQGFTKLFYLGPMFRAERPQAGRYRQFHQYGVEAIGSSSPWIDVEVIAVSWQMLRECGLSDAVLWVASMGCRADQTRSAQQLRERLAAQQSALCKDCQARFDKNIFRTLDCKQEACRALAWSAAGPTPFLLCEACASHFDDVRRGLRDLGIPFDDTQVFARGLDYYTRTVFELRAKGLGAQDAVAAGGRYDHLVEELGGPSLGAIGFAAGMERLLMASAQQQGADAPVQRRGVYIAVAQAGLIAEGLRIAQQLRGQGILTLLDYDGKSLKAQLREADRARCRLVAILGPAELEQRALTMKDLEQGTQEAVPMDTLIDMVTRRIQPASCHARSAAT